MSSQKSLLAFCVVFKLGLYGFAAGHYGYLSDELYFLDAASHPAFGYVDFPPLIAWLAAAVAATLGESLYALRFVPMLAGLGVTLLAVDICRMFGGRALAQWLTALAVLLAPGFVSIQAIFTMNALDQFWWALSFWLLLRYIDAGSEPGSGRGAARYMIGLGLALGFGILTKLSALVLCAAIPVGLLLWYPEILRRRETVIAITLVVVISAPFAIWQFVNAFPLLEFIRGYNRTPPAAMVLQNPVVGLLITLNPAYLPIWAPGSVDAFFAGPKSARLASTIAWCCLIVFFLTGVKFYFALPAFIVFFAAGAVLWERLLQGRKLLQAMALCVALSGALSLPTAAPILSAARLQAIADKIRDGLQGFPGEAPAEIEPYFPHFAEMHGWPELVEATAQVVAALPPAERERLTLFAAHYGQAGALNVLDTADRLPTAHSGHMSYDLWSRGIEFEHTVFVGFERAELEPLFARLEEKATLHCERCMAREQGLKIFYAAEPAASPDEIRAHLKRYYFF